MAASRVACPVGGQAVPQAAAVARDRLDPAVLGEDFQVADEGRPLQAEPFREAVSETVAAMSPMAPEDAELRQLQPERP